jgi:hypothetical protein
MLVDGGAAVNLMSCSIFKKLERKDDELVKTNLMLNDVGGGGATQWWPRVSSPWSSPQGASRSLLHSLSSRCKITIVLFLAAIGFTPTAVFLLLWTNS